MRTLIVLFLFLITVSTNIKAQDVKFGLKGGANFSKLDSDNVNSSILTSYHFGALVEINVLRILSLQPEVLFSSQGAKVEGADDFKLDYISAPVLVKFYIIPNKFSIDLGPQFSFLVKDDVPSSYQTETFDFAGIGGIGLNINKTFFAQARYVVGLTDLTTDTAIKNKVIQLSVGVTF